MTNTNSLLSTIRLESARIAVVSVVALILFLSTARAGDRCGNFCDSGCNICQPYSGSQPYSSSDGSGAMLPDPGDPGAPFAAASAPMAVAPNMIGDFFGTGISTATLGSGLFSNMQLSLPLDFFSSTKLQIPDPTGTVIGRQKIAENTSPIPRDRLFINYSHFDSVPLTAGDVNVNRFSPGFEKTFLDGMASLEMRFPIASTLDSDLRLSGINDTSHTEFGNININLKSLVWSNCNSAISAGLGITIPTADDLALKDLNDRSVAVVQNDSVHLLPFIGGLHTPNENLFVQWYLQFDFDANGNDVLVDTGNGLRGVGSVEDATFMFFDVSAGYWIYRNECACQSGITGFAPMVELHLSRSLESTDVLRGPGGIQVGRPKDDIQILNGVIGGVITVADDKTITAAYVVPIGNGADQQFDSEFRLFFNWFFGGDSNRSPVYNRPTLFSRGW